MTGEEVVDRSDSDYWIYQQLVAHQVFRVVGVDASGNECGYIHRLGVLVIRNIRETHFEFVGHYPCRLVIDDDALRHDYLRVAWTTPVFEKHPNEFPQAYLVELVFRVLQPLHDRFAYDLGVNPSGESHLLFGVQADLPLLVLVVLLGDKG